MNANTFFVLLMIFSDVPAVQWFIWTATKWITAAIVVVLLYHVYQDYTEKVLIQAKHVEMKADCVALTSRGSEPEACEFWFDYLENGVYIPKPHPDKYYFDRKKAWAERDTTKYFIERKELGSNSWIHSVTPEEVSIIRLARCKGEIIPSKMTFAGSVPAYCIAPPR